MRQPAIHVHPQSVVPRISWTQQRILIVALAAAVLILRMPTTLYDPQFWAEDGILFRDSYENGLRSILFPLAGYPIIVTRLVAWLCTRFDIAWAPRLFTYSSIAIDLVVVWLVSSPRFPFPHKVVSALAIVLVPQGFEVLGALANSQWVLPIGVAAVILMSTPASRITRLIEGAFVALVAVTSPYASLMLPGALFLWWHAESEQSRCRLLIFIAILLSATAIHAAVVWTNVGTALLLDGAQPIAEQIGHTLRRALTGVRGAINVAVVAGLAALLWLAVRKPLCNEKLFLWLLILLTFLAAMAKQRADFATIATFNFRYTYAAAVYVIWFACAHLPLRLMIGCVLVIMLGLILFRVERERIEFSWTDYARRADEGLTPFPVAPHGWIIHSR